jgi:hypothetical protein
MREEDLPWLSYLCKKRYSDRYDEEGTINWFRNICLKGPLLFQPIRTDNAFCITMLSVLPWLPAEWEANVVFICADVGAGWDAIHLLRASIEWGRKRKAHRWRLMSETDFDLAPLAKRLGATELSPRYSLRL